MKSNMKIAKLLVYGMLIAFIAAVGCATAEESTITGMVEQTDMGLMIKAAEGDYLVAGQDLTPMAGKKVTVKGAVAEGENGKTITVTSIEEITD